MPCAAPETHRNLLDKATNEYRHSHDNALLTGQRLLHLPLLVVQLMDEGVRQLARLHQPLQVVPDQECLEQGGGKASHLLDCSSVPANKFLYCGSISPHSSPFLLQPHPPFHLGRSLNLSKLSCLLSTLSPTTGPSILPLLTLGTLVRAPQQSLWSAWCLSRAGTWSSPAWSAWLATSRGTVCPSWRDLPDWSHSLSPSTGLTSVMKSPLINSSFFIIILKRTKNDYFYL
jgi:hypothetical protein